jgi:hypothetical protein
MPTVLNKKLHGVPTGAVYIGRPSIWGNPFVIGKDGTRDEVIAKFEAHIRRKPDLLGQLHKLADKDVVCWCAPARCHGDVLIRMANQKSR